MNGSIYVIFDYTALTDDGRMMQVYQLLDLHICKYKIDGYNILRERVMMTALESYIRACFQLESATI